jgi:hypothetical protein
LLDQRVPLAAGLQQRFGQLTHGAMTAGAPGLPGAEARHLRHCIANGDRQAGSPHQRDIRQIVSNTADLRPIEIVRAHQLLDHAQFVAAVRLTILDVQVFRARDVGARPAATDQIHVQAGPLHQL